VLKHGAETLVDREHSDDYSDDSGGSLFKRKKWVVAF
jgi:hypothetical protein